MCCPRPQRADEDVDEDVDADAEDMDMASTDKCVENATAARAG